MAGYSTSNPPRLVSQPIAGQRTWQYVSPDAIATVNTSGYITNGGALGMKVGDRVEVTDTTNNIISSCTVVSVSSTAPGAVDLSDGVTIGTAASNAD